MLHFVTSYMYMRQNKRRKQTLESPQNGLEIIFKLAFDAVAREKSIDYNSAHVCFNLTKLFFSVFSVQSE